jgi:hypothetical protein
MKFRAHRTHRRLLPVVLRSALAMAAAGPLALAGCRKTPPEPVGQGSAAPSPSTSAHVIAATPRGLSRPDPASPPRAPMPTESVTPIPQPKREPDWDLDGDDAARDYVRRYALGTKRYGESLDCVDVGGSEPAGGRRRVEVKTAANCPGAGTVRDVFLVDVALDRLGVDDRSKRDPLAHWPDGSDPEGPAATVREITGMRDWKVPLKDVLQRQQLVPVRVQGYGRGTYPVVTIAGWHAAVLPTATPEALRPFAEALCQASGGMPLGLFAGLDRTLMLRVRCPAATRWDHL